EKPGGAPGTKDGGNTGAGSSITFAATGLAFRCETSGGRGRKNRRRQSRTYSWLREARLACAVWAAERPNRELASKGHRKGKRSPSVLGQQASVRRIALGLRAEDRARRTLASQSYS